MNEEITTHEAKEATPNQGTLQSYIQNFTKEAIDAIVEIMRTTKNESLRMGAAKTIIDKSIGDKKSVEVTGENGEPIKLTILTGNGFVPSSVFTTSPSTGSDLQLSAPLQSIDLASESTEDDNSDNGSGETSTPS